MSEEEHEKFFDCIPEGAIAEAGDESGGASTRLDSIMPPSSTTQSVNAHADTDTDTRRPRSASSTSRNRYSSPLPEKVPAVPAIPQQYLGSGKRAKLGDASKESRLLHIEVVPSSPSPSPIESTRSPKRQSFQSSPRSTRTRHIDTKARRKSLPASLVAQVHQETLSALESGEEAGDMSRVQRGKDGDLFLELANDQSQAEEGVRPRSRSERIASRLSFSGNRRSLPAENALMASADRRPKSSGNIFANRPSSRLGPAPSDLARHVNRYRDTASRADDAVSVSARSRASRSHRYSVAPDRRSTMSPSQLADIRSQELPHYGRRRPSFGETSVQATKTRPSQLSKESQDSPSESPADSSEPKQSLPDSESVDSQTADTVWDELDDLKSRIKKLELTGKLPPTSGAAMSSDAPERPRTATTAPTTIDSSPKHETKEKKPEPEAKVEAQAADGAELPPTANIHPLLHSALAKAKPLISSSLYRPLEATAMDALQLAAMTGSAGPQGTAYSAAAIINGVTVADRHVRRKADTMCRNLTDLCLALCDGKHGAPSVISSPVTLNTPAGSSPTLRYSRSSLGPNDASNRSGGNRPMSRLEARRTSILGSQAGSSVGSGGEELSASEQETPPSQYLKVQESRRFSRAGSRLSAARSRYDDVSGDEDPTIRPPSRAFSNIDRTKPLGPRDNNAPPQQRRTASLRDSLAARRVNSGAYEGNHELSRVASLSSESGHRRRTLDPSTPPVVEEEDDGEDYQPISQPKRRVTSTGLYSGGNRRATADLPTRATSLNQRRHIVVE